MKRTSSQNRRVQGNGKPNGSEAWHGAFAAKAPKRRGCWRRSFLLHLRKFEPLCWFRRLWTACESFVAVPKRNASVQRTSYRRRLQGETLCDRALMAGDLDITFDGDGKVTTALGSELYVWDSAYSVAIQNDGKIVVAGSSTYNNGGCSTFALTRYNSDGSLDTTFDDDGKVTTAVGSSNDVAYSVAIQSDGKIVVAGESFNGSNYDFALARYNSDGGLDTTFDGDGKVTTAVGSSQDFAYSVAIQSDGKIVIAGYSNNGSNSEFALTRYNSDGSLDTTFDGDGKVTTAVGSVAYAYSITIQSDGKIVAAGMSYAAPKHDFALTRYNSDGSLDTTFDGDGKVTTSVGSSQDFAYSVAIQSDGKIVAAGSSYNGNNRDFALTRYNSDGSLDTTFDGDGKVTTAVGSAEDSVYSVAIQNDGKIVVAGYSWNGSNYEFALTRYNSDGSLDPTFDGDGKVTTSVGSSHAEAYSVAIQSDGKIVAAGSSWNDGIKRDFALARYHVSEAPTDITLSLTSIAENAPANITVGTLSTIDPDARDTFTYTFVSGTGSIDNAAFNISGKSLRATSSFNFETKSSYTIRIRSTDQAGLFTEKTFTITVIDINESPTSISLSSNTIAENAAANTPVGTLSTTDPDVGNTFTYTLVTGTGDTDNASFNINGSTLQATSGFDFETKASYTVRVRSTDQGDLFTEKVFTITVTNVNEAPTDIALSSSTIAENANTNSTIGTLSTLDIDTANTANLVVNGSFENGTFAKPGDANYQSFGPGYTGTLILPGQSLIANWDVALSPFDPDQTFLGGTGPFGLEWTAGVLENQKWVDLNRSGDLWRISQRIATQIGLTYLVSFDTLVGNVMGGATLRTQFDGMNSTSVDFTGSNIGPPRWHRVTQMFVADANVTTLSFMAVSTGIDPSSGPQIDLIEVVPIFTYALVAGAGDTDNSAFNVNGSTLRTNNVFDFETKPNYSIRLRSTDQGGLFTEKAFTITVTDVNEAPTDILLSSASIAENAGANTIVGTLSTSDPDAGNTFTYSMVAGTGDTDNGAFNISGNSLRANDSFDFETKSSYSIRVRSSDQGGLFVEKTFLITVIDVNETPTDISLSSSMIAENAGANAVVGALSTIDPDSGNTFTYSVVTGAGDADNGSFNISGNSLRATSSFDFETKSSYTVRVRSADQNGLFVEKTFMIRILDVNDAPVVVSDSYWISVDTFKILDVLANDSDIDSAIDPTSIEIVQPPSHGTAMPLPDGTVRYTPNAGYRGAESFTYRVRDSLGLLSNSATVQLRVNSAPKTTPDSLVAKQTITTVLDVLRNDSDPDGSLDPTTLVIVSGSEMADVVAQSNGTIRFTPREGFLGTTQFRYVVSDNDGRPSVPTDVTMRVVVSIYQNPRNRFDVDDDGTASPLDVLVLINLLNSQAPSIPVDGLPGPPAYVDVNADNRVDPLDVLDVINHINSRGNGEGEGDASSTLDDVFAFDDWQEDLRKTNRRRLFKF